MKTLIIAINSKYIHSALAPWYLKAACNNDRGVVRGEVVVAEYTINELHEDILSSIYQQKPDAAAFSCYIWNIETVLRVASELRKVLPQTTIILGGPEVSYDTEDILKEHEYIDYILAGEGERSFPELIALLERRKACGVSDSERIEGLTWRSVQGIVSREPAYIKDLSMIPSPYSDEMLKSLNNKIAYFESSRGCPFSCSYCLSSASEGVRFFPLERVFAELERLAASGVKQIKFVDRTFNVNSERARAIIRYILEMRKSGLDCNFHLEVGADLFDEETLALLETAPKGLFQLEAGVQTANETTLDAVCRKTDLQMLFSNLARLKKHNNVHIHTDLIAGLPYENYYSFIHSFNTVYSLRSHQLQLGFLKFLRGTALRRNALDLGFAYQNQPPYEILSGNDISYEELIVLKGIAKIVDRFYNSGRFLYSLDYAIENFFSSPFEFFDRFYRFLKENDCIELRTGLRELYAIFDRFVTGQIHEIEMREREIHKQELHKRSVHEQNPDDRGIDEPYMQEQHKLVFRELLRLDFLASDRSGTLPDFMEIRTDHDFINRCYDFLRSSENITDIIPEATGLSAKLLLKRVHFERFSIDLSIGDSSVQFSTAAANGTVLLFNYMSQDKVTGRYPFFQVKL